MSELSPRVLVLGTGAMASVVGARLARTGEAQVTLAGTWDAALDRMRSHGLAIEEGGESVVSFPGACRLADAPRSDIVVVLVKSTHTADPQILRAARRSAEAGGVVVTLQNGLGNREILEQAAGRDRVVVGVASFGATLLGPAHVRAFPGSVLLGLSGRRPETDAAATRLSELLTHAGLPAQASSDVGPLVWGKLAVNCAINPLAALTGLSNGALLRNPRLRTLMGHAAAEVEAVALAHGIKLARDAAEQAENVALATAGNRASMLQDLDRGVPTEIEFLNGAVVQEARRLKIKAPVNDWLWRSVRAREATCLGGASLSA